MDKCSGITRSGERCRSIAITGSDYCHAHHPERAQQRRQAASKGGKRGGRGRVSPHSQEIASVKALIKEVVNDVRVGRLPTSRGNTLASLWHVLLRAIEADLKCIEVDLAIQERTELIARMEELERLLDDKKEAGRWGA